MKFKKEDIERKIRKVSLIAAIGISSIIGNKANATEKDNTSKAKIEQTISTKEHSNSVRQTFSASQIAHAFKTSGINPSKSEAFIESYMDKLDAKGAISAKDMISVLQEFCSNKEQMGDFFNSLSSEKQHGYNYGSGTISFTIDEKGEISRLSQRGTSPNNSQHIKEINEAISRHKGIGVDRMEASLEASQFITKMQIMGIVNKKQANGEPIANGDKFLNNFAKELSQNGLEIGKDDRLHGIEASKNKPLKTENDLLNDYKKQKTAQYTQFTGGR